jgi:hypothetical protein
MRFMPRKKLDFETVKRIALGMPDVDASTTAQAVKVRGKLLTWIPINKSAEPGSLAVRIDLDRRAELLAEAPEVYYVTDHYVNYPVVLVRLSRIQPDALPDLLSVAWRFVTAKTPGGKRAIRKQKNSRGFIKRRVQ